MADPNTTLALEPVAEGDNSLIRYLRSMTNVLGQQGQKTFQSGQDIFGGGVKGMQPGLEYWQKILSGNRAEMESAVGPEKQSILERYRASRKNLAATSPRSGGTNEAVAQSEFSQAGDIAKLFQTLRPTAATQSSEIAANIARLGIADSEMGMRSLMGAMSGLLDVRGQDLQESLSNRQMIGSIAKGLGSLLGGWIAGGGSLGSIFGGGGKGSSSGGWTYDPVDRPGE